MAQSLKESNKWKLYLLLVGNFAVFYLAIKTGVLFGKEWAGLVTNWVPLIPVGFGLIAVSYLNGLLSSEVKAKIVFFRWRNPNPGSEAFSKFAREDPRVDLDALRTKYGALPTDRAEQNQLWYQIYRTVKDEPSVLQAHREYLLTRDSNCLALMILVLLGGAGFFEMREPKTAWLYVGLLILQFLVSGQAARTYGRALVKDVLAIKSADD